MDLLNSLRTFFRDNPRMLYVVGLAVLTTGALAWWVYGGFSLEVGKFFAAEPAVTGVIVRDGKCYQQTQELGQCPPGEAVCYGLPEGCGWTSDRTPARELRVGGLDMDPVSGLLFNVGTGDPNDHTTWQWNNAPTTIEDWCTPDFDSGRADPPPQRPPSPAGIRCPDGSSGGQDYGSYPHCGSMVTTETEVACPPGALPTATTLAAVVAPTPTPVPIAVTPVLCSPDTQTIAPNAPVYLQAVGGNGSYQWDVTGGGVITAGGNENITITYAQPGTKTVRVNSGGTTATCSVLVQVPGMSDVPVVIDKKAANQTSGSRTLTDTLIARPGATIQFVAVVRSTTSRPLENLTFVDSLPFEMSYVDGSTSIDGTPLTVDTVTTTGLSLGTLQPGDGFTVRWSAVVDPNLSGNVVEQPKSTVSADGIIQVTDGVELVLGGTPVSGAGGVPTGPGDAVVLALAASAGLTLLYAAYTRSRLFHRREARTVSRKRSPLDFRL